MHPESYKVAKNFIEILDYSIEGFKSNRLGDIEERINNFNIDELAKKLDIGKPTLLDIIKELKNLEEIKRRVAKTYI